MGNTMEFLIEYYDLPDGTCPAYEFITSQPKKMEIKITKVISLLEEFGNNLGMPYSKHLDDGIFELRISQGNDATRLLYFFVVGKRVIITHGFNKDTQKTPKKEIKKAKKYRSEYIGRNHD